MVVYFREGNLKDNILSGIITLENRAAAQQLNQGVVKRGPDPLSSLNKNVLGVCPLRESRLKRLWIFKKNHRKKKLHPDLSYIVPPSIFSGNLPPSTNTSPVFNIFAGWSDQFLNF